MKKYFQVITKGGYEFITKKVPGPAINYTVKALGSGDSALDRQTRALLSIQDKFSTEEPKDEIFNIRASEIIHFREINVESERAAEIDSKLDAVK